MKVVAIIGRTNVGKSTLFNRLIKKRFAVTSATPQTTRDRLYSEISWNGEDFILVDTAGLNIDLGDAGKDKEKRMSLEIREQVYEAINEADFIVFVVSVREGLSDKDKEIADMLRKSEKPIILAINKVDNKEMEKQIDEFYNLGLGEIIPVSAISGRSSGDLLDEITKGLKRVKPKGKIKRSDISVGIIGRPNVGKSTLINQLAGKNRVLVSDLPGTTIDTVDIFIEHNGKTIRFIDTAGIRRRGKIRPGVEKFSVLRAIKAISRSDIVVLLLDAEEGITKQDLHIASFVLESGRGLILAVNKWDLAEKETSIDAFLNSMRRKIRFLPWSPVVFISAKTGKNVAKIMELILIIDKNRNEKIKTRILNEIISKAVMENSPKTKTGKAAKIYFSTQIGVNPPTFTLKVNDKDLFHFSYLRYLERKIRTEFDFTGTPIKIELKGNKNETGPNN